MLRFLFLAIVCHFSLWGDVLVFSTPIFIGKVDKLKNSLINSEEEKNLLQELHISKYHRWIQKIREDLFLIHHLEGEDLNGSLAQLRERIDQNHPSAIALQNLYQETLGVNICRKDWTPTINHLTDLVTIEIDHASDTLVKEYCFVYPLIPSKREKLLQLYEDQSYYQNPLMHEIYRQRGVAKLQQWIQESAEPYIVLYQEIIGPVKEAREKHLSSKESEYISYIANAYVEITGLSFEELLPSLESLDDSEILD